MAERDMKNERVRGPRVKAPQGTVDSVLIASGRRCCICFGLNRDTGLKSGQVAHLDRERDNNNEDNLAFLCLDHHDHYDSKTSQRKNFTITEVKHYRQDLYGALELCRQNPVSFGEVSSEPAIGHYVRVNGGKAHSAELLISKLLDGRYHISGTALWGIDRIEHRGGPNMGMLDFVGELENQEIRYSHESFHDGPVYIAVLRFDSKRLVIVEENSEFCPLFGMNVRFEGEYNKLESCKDGYNFPLGGWHVCSGEFCEQCAKMKPI